MNQFTPLYVLGGLAVAGGTLVVGIGAWPDEGGADALPPAEAPPSTTASLVAPPTTVAIDSDVVFPDTVVIDGEVVPLETIVVNGVVVPFVRGPQGETGAASQLPGPRGEKGDPGETVVGPPGVAGSVGARGDTGRQGDPGRDGRDGADSQVPGPVGPAGADSQVPGPQGEPGEDSQVPGPQGEPGIPGPSCPPGYHLETIELHQRAPVDQDLPVTVCVTD